MIKNLLKEEVIHIAKLARLGLTDAEIEKYQKDLSTILSYIEKLKEVDVEEVEPASHSVPLENVMRKDKVRLTGTSAEEAEKLRNLMPETKNGYLKVKSIF